MSGQFSGGRVEIRRERHCEPKCPWPDDEVKRLRLMPCFSSMIPTASTSLRAPSRYRLANKLPGSVSCSTGAASLFAMLAPIASNHGSPTAASRTLLGPVLPEGDPPRNALV
ncbi:hypothetical protein [Actinoalloteichus fjordicus]|uniref:hypothetical protein n=1 Tax=Actinoalloteichus fjordicus TaxID=1612552 RepID=UPI0012F8D15F|nr:hypothetical protein [Actinoalloteichus fjordicus]